MLWLAWNLPLLPFCLWSFPALVSSKFNCCSTTFRCLKGNLSQKQKNYQRFLMFRIAGGTSFSFQILKHKRMEEFQPLFYSFWCLSCLLKFSNFSLTFFNLCSHSPSFILKLFNLTSNSSRLNNLNTKHGEWEHRLKKVREKLDNLSKQLRHQNE